MTSRKTWLAVGLAAVCSSVLTALVVTGSAQSSGSSKGSAGPDELSEIYAYFKKIKRDKAKRSRMDILMSRVEAIEEDIELMAAKFKPSKTAPKLPTATPPKPRPTTSSGPVVGGSPPNSSSTYPSEFDRLLSYAAQARVDAAEQLSTQQARDEYLHSKVDGLPPALQKIGDFHHTYMESVFDGEHLWEMIIAGYRCWKTPDASCKG